MIRVRTKKYFIDDQEKQQCTAEVKGNLPQRKSDQA